MWGATLFLNFVLLVFQTIEFVNFSDYSNFLPSFQVLLPHEATSVKLQLSSLETPLPLIGWLFRSTDSVKWERVIQLSANTGEAC